MKFKRLLSAFAVSLLMAAAAVAGLSGPAAASTTYYYAGGVQTFTTGTIPSGIQGKIYVAAPPVDRTAPNTESHSLAELAVQQGSGATRQLVEVGTTVDPILFGDTNPHLFVYNWVNNVGQGYNNAGFQQCNPCAGQPDVWDLGDTLTVGVLQNLGINHYSAVACGASAGGWWVYSYANGATFEWLGCFPDSIWTNAGVTFTSAPTIHAFGEVGPDTGSLGCTDMGLGALPTMTTGATISSVTAVGRPATDVNILGSLVVTDNTKYNVVAINGQTFRYGGPGAC